MAIAPAGMKRNSRSQIEWRRKWKWCSKALRFPYCSFSFLIFLDVLVHLWLNTTITYLTIQIIININPSKYCVWLPITLFSFLFLFFHSYLYLVAKEDDKMQKSTQKDIIIPDTREKGKTTGTEMNIKFMKFRFNVWIKQKTTATNFMSTPQFLFRRIFDVSSSSNVWSCMCAF